MTGLASVGFVLEEPGPGDWGPSIDQVPSPTQTGDLVAANLKWRGDVEADLERRLSSGSISVWFPLRLPDDQVIIPLVGGNPSKDWSEALRVLTAQAHELDTRQVRVVDLTRHALWKNERDRYRSEGASTSVRSASLSPGATSSDLLGGLDTRGVIDLVLDVLRTDDDRAGRNGSATLHSTLGQVTGALERDPIGLGDLRDAVSFALTLDTSIGSLHPREEQKLIDFHDRRVKNSLQAQARLDELEQMLIALARFERVGKSAASGTDRSSIVSLRGIETGLSTSDHELAAGLLATRLAREIDDLDRTNETVTILLGADVVPEPTLRMITDAALRRRSRVFLFYERLAGPALAQIGSSGASIGGFFRLSNPREAAEAADFMGKQHRFELTGYSKSQGRSFDWGWSSSVGRDSSTSRSWQTGKLFSSTLSSSTSRSSSSSQNQGNSVSSGTSTDVSRVYEYLLEPATFQGLPAGSMLLMDVQSRTSRLVSLSSDVLLSQLRSRDYYVELGA